MVSVNEITLAVHGRSQELLVVKELEELFWIRTTARRPEARTAPACKEDGEELLGRHGSGRVLNSEAWRERGEPWQGQAELHLRLLPEQ